MTSDELNYAVNLLRKSLARPPLEWILREVDETLRLGKPAVRTVIETKEETPEMIHLSMARIDRTADRAKRRTIVPTTLPYTKQEELVLLLEALQRTAIAASDMLHKVVVTISARATRNGQVPRIVFERDGRESSSIAGKLDVPADPQIEKLRTAVTELRKMVE